MDNDNYVTVLNIVSTGGKILFKEVTVNLKCSYALG